LGTHGTASAVSRSATICGYPGRFGLCIRADPWIWVTCRAKGPFLRVRPLPSSLRVAMCARASTSRHLQGIHRSRRSPRCFSAGRAACQPEPHRSDDGGSISIAPIARSLTATWKLDAGIAGISRDCYHLSRRLRCLAAATISRGCYHLSWLLPSLAAGAICHGCYHLSRRQRSFAAAAIFGSDHCLSPPLHLPHSSAHGCEFRTVAGSYGPHCPHGPVGPAREHTCLPHSCGYKIPIDGGWQVTVVQSNDHA